MTHKTVVCFGEVLWDILPTGKKAGGAPMNVAYHLQKLGINAFMVSSIGNDQPGEELLGFLNDSGLPIIYVQTDAGYPTSEVLAKITENNEVEYDIVYPVAWDYIKWEPALESLLQKSDAFVFGSLGSRNQTSRDTLFKMLDAAAYCVFDINLRAPYYSPEIISQLLPKANLVKLNGNELMLISAWFDDSCKTEEEAIRMLFTKFKVAELLITKGSKGASYYTPSLRYDYPAYTVRVEDTVGSGDSFLAAFLAMKLRGETLEATMDYAIGMGAFITSRSGACPPYSKADLDEFIQVHKTGESE